MKTPRRRRLRERQHPFTASDPATSRPRIIGLGKFSSGIRSLGSNKKYLKRFGRRPRLRPEDLR